MQLRPSEIYYSQKSIKSTFSNSKGIGVVVNDICSGRDSINNISTIKVAKVGDKWFTADNRRLWVFKELETRGKCHQITVNVISAIPQSKMTTTNGGVSVRVRGNPYVSGARRHRHLRDLDDFDLGLSDDDFSDYDCDYDYYD